MRPERVLGRRRVVGPSGVEQALLDGLGHDLSNAVLLDALMVLAVLEDRAERVLDRKERPQWDKSWVLLLITALLAIEWLLRKRWQMI